LAPNFWAERQMLETRFNCGSTSIKILVPASTLASSKARQIGAYAMEQHIFVFSFIVEGSTEKVLQFLMPFKSIYNKNLCVIEQKMYF
jgi:hypothetical protein